MSTHETLTTLVRTLWDAPIGRLKNRAEKFGPVNPVGDGDSKTATPSTYRPVGATCPQTCAYLWNGCYAQGGNVNLHQVRASDETDAAVRAAAIGMVWAVRTGKLCRLHVSGDFITQGRIDHLYIARLGMLADIVNDVAKRPRGTQIAWSYTHIDQPTFAPYQRQLATHGVWVRYSDYLGPNGAIVHDFDTLPALKADKGVKYIKCPAQMPQSLTCAECKLCWTKGAHTIVFEPHGVMEKKARTASLKVLQ